MEPTQAYGSTGAWAPSTAHPQERAARRRAVAAAWVQLAGPFVYVGMILAGLTWDIPTTDPHGYTILFAFLFALVLLIPVLGLAIAALVLLRKARRSGAVLLAIVSVVAAVEGLGLAVGFPGGTGWTEPIRIVTTAVGTLWFLASVACLIIGLRAFSRLPRRS